ncbi:hypothetical protein HOC80_02325 [archaeon]|jgi:hypothetical protein|nr:hypothetical protein [archaeon]MBT4416916.1 hypothetical protein [archaeon]
MKITDITQLRDKIESGQISHHKRKGFLDSFAAKFLQQDGRRIGMESGKVIEAAASLLNDFDFSNHARKILNHQGYLSFLELGDQDPIDPSNPYKLHEERPHNTYFKVGDRAAIFFNDRWHPATVTNLCGYDASQEFKVDYPIHNTNYHRGRGLSIWFQNPGVCRLEEFGKEE